MATGALWHTRPIFITSTFRDMQAERDWLRDRVFPVLEERLRARHTYLEPIDLRWGVETVSTKEEEAKELLVLKVCLAEVERSRPFLIGLLGDRYGWVPPAERMAAAAREAGFEQPVAGRSVTDLEIDFGVLSSEDQRRRCLFCFREPQSYDELIASGQMKPETAADYSEAHRTGEEGGTAKLDALKARIDKTLPDRVRNYNAEWDPKQQKVTGLEAWGQQVLDDLWQELEQETAEWVEQGADTWQVAERFTLEQFLENRTRDFVGRKTILNELEALAISAESEKTPCGACVTARAGAGKSALFAEINRRLQQNNNIIVLTHAAGISPRSTQVDSLLRRWIEELEPIAGVSESLPENANAEEVEQTFHSLLGRVSTKQRVVLLIDALNQFEPTPRAQYLTWLPQLWPPNARLIATAIPGTASDTLSQRDGIEAKALPPLDQNEAVAITHTICQRYRRSLHADVLVHLLNKQQPDNTPATGNALWLQLAVEELNLLDADDFARLDKEFEGTPDHKMHQLLLAVVEAMPTDVEGLYGWLLERAEQLHGKAWAQTFVNLIAVSRAGWRESDFRVLIPKFTSTDWDELTFAALRRTFRAHVVQRGASGQWNFAHVQLRLAVERRSLKDAATVQALHGALADYLKKLTVVDPLHESETLVHLIGTNDQILAASYYGGELTEGELAGATAYLVQQIIIGEQQEPNPGLNLIIGWLSIQALGDGNKGTLCHRYNFDLIINELDILARLDTRFKLLNAIEKTIERLLATDPANVTWQRDLSASYQKIGDVKVAQGDLGCALGAYSNSLDIMASLLSIDPSNTLWQGDLSVYHNKVGEVRQAQGDLLGSLEAYKLGLEIRRRLVKSEPSNIKTKRDLSLSHVRIGGIQEEMAELSGALESYQASIGIMKGLVVSDPDIVGWQRDLSVSYERYGDVCKDNGDLSGALESYQDVLAIRVRLAAMDPGNMLWQHDLSVNHDRIGDVRKQQGDLLGALEDYQAGIVIRQRLAATDSSNTGWQQGLAVSYSKIGETYQAQGNLSRADESYQGGVAIIERLAAMDPGNAIWQRHLSASYSLFGYLYLEQGDLSDALEACQAGLAIIERLVIAEPGNPHWQGQLWACHGFIGQVCQKQDDLLGAYKAYQTGLGVMEQLVESAPEHVQWQENMSTSHRMVGDVCKKLGNLSGALEAYRAGLTIMERLVTEDPNNIDLQRDLSTIHEKIAEGCREQGDLIGARIAYQAVVTIRERLTLSEPGDLMSWQHILSVCHNNLGEVCQQQGDLPVALKEYQLGLEIRERLAMTDPRNTRWKHVLSASYDRIGGVRQDMGNLLGALEAYQESLEIRQNLAAADPENTDWQRDLVVSFSKLAGVMSHSGDNASAQAYLQSCYQTLIGMKQKGMYLDPPLLQFLKQLGRES